MNAKPTLSTTDVDAPKSRKEVAQEQRTARLQERADKAARLAAESRTKTEIALIHAVRKARLTHPEGKFDRKGKFYPSPRDTDSD